MSRLTDLITRHEGTRTKPYTDTAGKITIGIGRNLTDVGLSNNEIRMLFLQDMGTAQARCAILFPTWDQLSAVRQAVLIDMMFNLGPGRLRGFKKMRRALRQADYETAAVEMLDSVWADQVGRRKNQRAGRLAEMMQTNQW
jgi:lysozyme|tara:strand:- start:730 stop:1152 length:423 start_codon:yes stop_codon:yes gene_type:complete